MKRTPLLALLIVLLFIAQVKLMAQINSTISGVVVNEKKQPVNNATVSLFTNNAKDTLRKLTSQLGKFTFSINRNTDSIGIKIQSIGYETVTRYYPVSIYVGKNIVDTIVLPFSINILQSVTVNSGKSVLIKEDTVEYKADSFKVKPNALVEELLKKLPGIQVDKNGNITAQGKSVSKVKVDGKDFFSGDVKTATQQLPANIIDKIQVIDDYGDQAQFTGVKDGDPQKVLNLQIKKDKNTGYFGNANLGKGTDSRYQLNGALFKFKSDQQVATIANLNNTGNSLFNFSSPLLGSAAGNGTQGGMMGGNGMQQIGGQSNNGSRTNSNAATGLNNNDGLTDTKSIGINFRNQWGKDIAVYGSYQYSARYNKTETAVTQENIFTNGTNLSLQNNNNINDGYNHRFNLNMEYQLDSLNYFKITPSLNLQNNAATTYSTFETLSQSKKTNQGTQNNLSNSNAPNFSGNLLYNHRFHKRGRNLSVNLSFSDVETTQIDNNSNLSTYYLPNGTIVQTDRVQNINQQQANNSMGVRLSYNEPIQKNKQLELNYSYNRQYTGNERINYVYDPQSGLYQYADSLSNSYNNEYHTHRVGLNYRFTARKFNYSVGMGIQPAIMNSRSTTNKDNYSQHLINYFPVARFTYQFTRSRSFDLYYSGRTAQPSYQQLQPVTDNTNQQNIITGNPFLRPEFTNTLSIRYNNYDYYRGDVFFSSISFGFTNDKIVNNTLNKGLGIQETRYLNANGYYSGSAFYYYSKPLFQKMLTINLNGNLNYNNNISYIDSVMNKAKNLVMTQGFSLNLTIGEWFEWGISGNFTANNTKNSINTQPSNNTRTYTYGTSFRFDLPGRWIINYTMDKTINQGFGNANVNPCILNTYVEKQLFKQTNASFRLQAFDLLNQNVNVTRTVSANAVSDSRSNRLGRYFMLSFIFRFASFGGKKISSPLMMIPMGQRPVTSGSMVPF